MKLVCSKSCLKMFWVYIHMYGNLPQLQGAGKAWKKSWNILEYISPRLWDVGKSLKIVNCIKQEGSGTLKHCVSAFCTETRLSQIKKNMTMKFSHVFMTDLLRRPVLFSWLNFYMRGKKKMLFQAAPVSVCLLQFSYTKNLQINLTEWHFSDLNHTLHFLWHERAY